MKCVRLEQFVARENTHWALGWQQTEWRKSTLFKSRYCPAHQGWRTLLHIWSEFSCVTMSRPLQTASIVAPFGRRGKTMKFAHPPSNAHAWHQSRLCDAVQPRRGISNNPLIAASVGSLGVLDVSRKRSREATSSLAASTQSFCAVSLFPSRRPIQTKPALTSACGSETNRTAPFVWCRGACGYRC